MKLTRYIILIILLATQITQAQQNKNKIQSSSFNYDTLNKIIINGLNKFRNEHGLDSLQAQEILVNAAVLSSTQMADDEKINPQGLAKTTPKYLKKAGATKKGEELAVVTPLGKGSNQLEPIVVAKAILQKWTLGKKEKDILLKPESTYIGLNCASDADEKRVYVSAMFGNYQSLNGGVKHKKELKVPFNTKSKKLKDTDPKKCKNCDKFKDYENLYKGLSVENGKVYLEYNNIKNLKRLLKRSTDGLAVDVVQKDQYSQADYNIMDNNLRNKGVMLKLIKKDKLFSKNLIKSDDPKRKNKKPSKLKVEMGVFPKGINGSYEFNLIVVQDGYVCKTVLRSYMEYTDNESSTPIEMLPMPESLLAKNPPFEPRSESALLTFTIPFEKNKSEFKQEDVKPFIEALHEPDFNIDGLYIYAYSSIEGDSVANAKLQRKRAESVTKVLQQMQQSKITPNIITNDSWQLFQLEMEDGKFDYLTKMTKQEAIAKINHTKGLAEELEPTLAKERFAQLVMDVTYDISGAKEEKFSIVQFNRMLKAGNLKQAYKILDYIVQKIQEKKYAQASFDKLEIPNDAKLIGLRMNKIYYNYILNNKVVSEDDYMNIQNLQKKDADNKVINYNALFCKIQLDSVLGDKTAQLETQLKIDALYKSDISKTLIDGLNIEWQFKIMDAIDTLDDADAQR
ncbi:MAG: CAP domain-containing protein, partial [Bacteroidia bacterium]